MGATRKGNGSNIGRNSPISIRDEEPGKRRRRRWARMNYGGGVEEVQWQQVRSFLPALAADNNCPTGVFAARGQAGR